MIRPITLLAFVAAAGSGLYLYQTKLSAQLLDRRITHTVDEIHAVRQRTALLTAEYALLNDPQRLQKLSDQFLQMPPTAPTQFVPMTDLASRLPPVGPPPSAPAPPQEAPPAVAVPGSAPDVVDTPVAGSAPPAPAGAVASTKPRTATGHAEPVRSAAAHLPDVKRLLSRTPASGSVLAEARPEPRPSPAHVAVARPASRPAPVRAADVVMPRPAPMRATPAVSMLGMAWTAPANGTGSNAPGGSR